MDSIRKYFLRVMREATGRRWRQLKVPDFDCLNLAREEVTGRTVWYDIKVNAILVMHTSDMKVCNLDTFDHDRMVVNAREFLAKYDVHSDS
jgi:hypothetical protein